MLRQDGIAMALTFSVPFPKNVGDGEMLLTANEKSSSWVMLLKHLTRSLMDRYLNMTV